MFLTQHMFANAAIWITHLISIAGISFQIFLNYKIKSTTGLSQTYILIYLSGYIVHLFYVFCLDLPIAYKVMGPLSFLLVLTLMFQFFFYKKRTIVQRPIKLYSINFFIFFSLIALAIKFPNKIGHLAGWISFVIWTVYQFPQIFKMYSNKSVEGFSFASVSIGGFQNLLGLIAALSLGVPLQSVFTALRGIIFFAIFCFQFWMYRKPSWLIFTAKTKSRANHMNLTRPHFNFNLSSSTTAPSHVHTPCRIDGQAPGIYNRQ